MKKFRSLFTRSSFTKKKNIDPFAVIFTLLLIVIIPSFVTGDPRFQYHPPELSTTSSQEKNIYKDKLFELTRSGKLVTELFDIALRLDNPILKKSEDLVAHVEFVSFGTRPTLVKLTYSIQDERGKEVFHENEQIIVETEKIISKKFNSLNIKGGKYSLILSTSYGENVNDEFRQNFEVQGISNIIKIILIILTAILIGVAIIYNNIKFYKSKK